MTKNLFAALISAVMVFGAVPAMATGGYDISTITFDTAPLYAAGLAVLGLVAAVVIIAYVRRVFGGR